MLLQDEFGQVLEAHSISAGLDYPGVGPEHAYLASIGRATYVPADDAQVLDALQLLARTEGIIPALESAHAIAWVAAAARSGEIPKDATVMITLSGRGDKDAETVFGILGDQVKK
jgi:tryptophan synthase beta chain